MTTSTIYTEAYIIAAAKVVREQELEEEIATANAAHIRRQVNSEVELYEDILEAKARFERIMAVKPNPTKPIHHEHLASLSQHDWYQSCYMTNTATRLEDATYCVVAKEQGQEHEVSFSCLAELMNWAGY